MHSKIESITGHPQFPEETSPLIREMCLSLFPRLPINFPEQHLRRQLRILGFAVSNNFAISSYSIGQNQLVVLDQEAGRIPLGRVEKYLLEQEPINQGAIRHKCFDFARKLVAKGIVTGLLYSLDCDGSFLGYGSHALNYDKLSDGSLAALDFTAAANIDSRMGNLDIMVIRRGHKEQLIESLGQLYGGQWSEGQ